ncbi:MAG: hypothetical protein B7X08_07265 [Acidocella sp. 20-63-7]|nr:MAG: hypothetical protein B7X08_07265 [Acidocella sp. 20-63-7]HQT46502.1 2OG-Fe(II) oxygenase [Acidocella sp.]
MSEHTQIAAQFLTSLATSRRADAPYAHWLLNNILPEADCDAIDAINVTPPTIKDTQGRRETHNSTRLFFDSDMQARYPVCRDLASALQSAQTVAKLQNLCNVGLKGSSLRIEYCLDTDGFWLEPHTDIGAKFFTMLIYLADPPEGEDWGTDVYSSPDTWVGSAPCERNRGLIFIPGNTTWHGFRKRPITGVRRSLIVNYVTPEWRARQELAFPNNPIA